MAQLLPRDAALPAEFPVFPLAGALLLPRGKLPLNIFEPRYLAMIEDALAAGRMFGMIQPDPNAPAGPNGPGLYRVGCLGRLSSFSETEDGRFLHHPQRADPVHDRRRTADAPRLPAGAGRLLPLPGGSGRRIRSRPGSTARRC